MASHKREHLNEAVRQKLGRLLQREASDPRFATVTITGVQLAKDYATALVMFSSYDTAVDVEKLTESLNKAAGFLGLALGRTLTSRRTPRLHFRYDPGFDHAMDFDLVLKSIESEHD